MDAMKGHTKHAGVAVQATKALLSLITKNRQCPEERNVSLSVVCVCLSAANQELAVLAGALAASVATMRAQLSSVDVMEAATSILQKICADGSIPYLHS